MVPRLIHLPSQSNQRSRQWGRQGNPTAPSSCQCVAGHGAVPANMLDMAAQQLAAHGGAPSDTWQPAEDDE